MHTTIMKPLPEININTMYAGSTNKNIPKKSQSAFSALTSYGGGHSEKEMFKETIMKRKKNMETFHRNEQVVKKHEFSASLKKNNIITNPMERIAM